MRYGMIALGYSSYLSGHPTISFNIVLCQAAQKYSKGLPNYFNNVCILVDNDGMNCRAEIKRCFVLHKNIPYFYTSCF